MRTFAAAAATIAVVVAIGACGSGGGDNPVAFCDAITDASLGGSVTSIDLEDQDSVDAAIAELTELAELAPSDIADDAAVVSEVYIEALEALADSLPGARDDLLRDLQPRLDQAAEPAARLERYATTTCALEFEAPAEPTPTPTPLDIDD